MARLGNATQRRPLWPIIIVRHVASPLPGRAPSTLYYIKASRHPGVWDSPPSSPTTTAIHYGESVINPFCVGPAALYSSTRASRLVGFLDLRPPFLVIASFAACLVASSESDQHKILFIWCLFSSIDRSTMGGGGDITLVLVGKVVLARAPPGTAFWEVTHSCRTTRIPASRRRARLRA